MDRDWNLLDRLFVYYEMNLPPILPNLRRDLTDEESYKETFSLL